MEGTYVQRERPKISIDEKMLQKKVKVDQGIPISMQQPTQKLPPRVFQALYFSYFF